MSEKPKRKPYRKGLKADYRGATPEQVAKALHQYRPHASERLASKDERPAYGTGKDKED